MSKPLWYWQQVSFRLLFIFIFATKNEKAYNRNDFDIVDVLRARLCSNFIRKWVVAKVCLTNQLLLSHKKWSTIQGLRSNKKSSSLWAETVFSWNIVKTNVKIFSWFLSKISLSFRKVLGLKLWEKWANEILLLSLQYIYLQEYDSSGLHRLLAVVVEKQILKMKKQIF